MAFQIEQLGSVYTSLLEWNQGATILVHIILILLVCLKYKKKDSNYVKSAQTTSNSRFNKMPSPPALPILGHIHLLRNYQHNPWEGFQQIRKQYGDIVSLKMGVHNMALVSDKDIMRHILLKQGDIFVDRQNFIRYNIIFGGNKENSLALCNWSEVHRDRRKMCKRAIVPGSRSARYQLLEVTVHKFVKDFIKRYNSGENVVHDSPGTEEKLTSFQKLTKLDVLFLCSDIFLDFLARDKRSHSSIKYETYVRGCDYIFWDITQGYVTDLLPGLVYFGVGYFYLKNLTAKTTWLRDYVDSNIFMPRYLSHMEKRKGLKQNQDISISQATENSKSEDEEDKDYLDTMIDDYMAKSTHLSLDDYKIGLTDLLAGSAAVGNILTKLLGHLALDRRTQDLIYEEAVRVDLSNLDSKPSLPVTEAALYEALRFASSPIVPHVAVRDTSIGNYYAPKGTTVLFNNYHINLTEQLWEDPLVYNPMRFLKVKEDGLGGKIYTFESPKHYMPFSMGQRQCLGFRMVEFISIITTAHICKNFTFKSDNEELTRRLLAPVGSAALNPAEECYNIHLYKR